MRCWIGDRTSFLAAGLLAFDCQRARSRISKSRNFRKGHVPGSPMGGTTGVSLEQGLGLTDVPRGCPGRRPGDERSYAPDYYFIIYKIVN